MYIVYSDFVWDTNWAGKLKELATQTGWNVVGYDLLPLGTADWSTVISKIKVADPDAVFHCDLGANDAAAFSNQFTTSSPPKALLHNSAGFASPQPLQLVDPKTLIGVTHFGSTGPVGGSKLEAFKTKFKQTFGIDATSDATHQYDSIHIAINAIRTAGSVDPAAVYNAIFSTVTPGLEGNWAFDAKTKLYYNYPEFTPDQIFQIQEHDNVISEFWSVYPSTVATAKWQLPPWFG
jgi:urea transport system substrate-binding protein